MTHFTPGQATGKALDPCRRGEIGSACRTPQSAQDGFLLPSNCRLARFSHWARQVGMETVLR